MLAVSPCLLMVRANYFLALFITQTSEYKCSHVVLSKKWTMHTSSTYLKNNSSLIKVHYGKSIRNTEHNLSKHALMVDEPLYFYYKKISSN